MVEPLTVLLGVGVLLGVVAVLRGVWELSSHPDPGLQDGPEPAYGWATDRGPGWAAGGEREPKEIAALGGGGEVDPSAGPGRVAPGSSAAGGGPPSSPEEIGGIPARELEEGERILIALWLARSPGGATGDSSAAELLRRSWDAKGRPLPVLERLLAGGLVVRAPPERQPDGTVRAPSIAFGLTDAGRSLGESLARRRGTSASGSAGP
jgi:hypothetical protein